MFSMVGSNFLLPAGFLPMQPIQLLVNNLLYDFSQLGIPLDNVDTEYLERPRRWNIKSIQKFMFYIGPISSIFDYATFFLMLYFFGCAAAKGLPIGDPHRLSLEKLFNTGWFVESLLTQTLIVHIIRTQRIPFFQSRASKTMTFTTLLIMGIGVYLPFSPVGGYFGMVPLPPIFFVWMVGFLLTYSVLTHTMKMWFMRRFGLD
jgi:Mg2+-importing ATPase